MSTRPDFIHAKISVAEVEALKERVAELERALLTIAEMPIPEQDNMISANMRVIARALVKQTRAVAAEGGE